MNTITSKMIPIRTNVGEHFVVTNKENLLKLER